MSRLRPRWRRRGLENENEILTMRVVNDGIYVLMTGVNSGKLDSKFFCQSGQ